MSDTRNPFNYPLNPEYGQGIYRRRVRLSNGTDEKGQYSYGELEDCNHGFCIKLYHDGDKVLSIEPSAKRIPLSTCEGAAKPLHDLIGKSIHASSKALNESMNPQANCTHWLDLSVWTMAMAARPNESVRDYEIAIPDELDGGTTASVRLNGEPLLEWLIESWAVKRPEIYADKPFYKGFASWANTIDDDNVREAAFILQKGYFVSRARLYDIKALGAEPASKHDMMRGACFSYSEPRVDVARRTINTVRDFTDTPEELLKFK